MKVLVTGKVREYLLAMGAKSIPDVAFLDDKDVAHHFAHLSHQLPSKQGEELEAHAIARAIWHSHDKVRRTMAHKEDVDTAVQVSLKPLERITFAIILLLVLLIIMVARAHAQIDVIQFQDNTGAVVGVAAAPLKFKAGANCTIAKSGSTYTFNCSGGAAGAGGSNTQIQFNSTGSLGGITTATSDGTVNTFLSGADFVLADPISTTKKATHDLSNITAGQTRKINVPDADGTIAQAIAAVSHKFITTMSSQGLFTLAQPVCADLSDSAGGCTMSTTAGGDLSGTLPSPTVSKVNGVSYGASPASHTVPVITAANTETYKSIPDCTDVSGNHINYTQSTDAFSCGTTSSGSGGSRIVCSQTSIQGGDTLTAAGSFATTCSIPGNTMAVGDVYDIWAAGSNGNSGTGSNWSYGLKFGTTTILSGSNVFENANINGFWREVAKIIVISTGVTGTIEAQGTFFSTATTANSATPSELGNTAVITIDTTANQVVTWTEVATPGGTSPTTTMRHSYVAKN